MNETMKEPKPAATAPFLKKRDDVTVQEIDGEALVYDAITSNTHRLNVTALFIWRLCDGEHDSVQIAQRVVDEYDVSFGSAVEHVERILAAFEERSLAAAAHGRGGLHGPCPRS